MKSPSASRRGRSAQVEEIKRLVRVERGRIEPLTHAPDLAALPGWYMVDGAIARLCRAGALSSNREAIERSTWRRLAGDIARSAVRAAHRDLVEIPALQAEAKRRRAQLGRILYEVDRLGRIRLATLAGEAMVELQVSQNRYGDALARARWLWLSGALNDVALKIDDALRATSVTPPLPSARKPLLARFVAAVCRAWEVETGRRPPVADAGPFVDLAAAMWVDAGLPDRTEGGRTTLQAVIGRAIRRHLEAEASGPIETVQIYARSA